MLDLADLHDAILESVAIQVAAGVVTFVLTPVQFEGAAKPACAPVEDAPVPKTGTLGSHCRVAG